MRKSESLAVTWRPIGKIRPYPGNPRKISQRAIEKVAASIKEYGWRQPIVVDEGGEILVGHTRYAAAKFLKLKAVPVHVARGLTVDQARAYRLADNRTHEEAVWDIAALEIELKALTHNEFDISLTGFDISELPREPDFTPSADPTSPPLDKLTDVKCPLCQGVFQMGARR